MRQGATYYAALSAEGGCLMGARGISIVGFPLEDGWVQPCSRTSGGCERI